MTPKDFSERLCRLHEAHVQKVDHALDAGRTDLAQELSDAYADEALLLITSEGAVAIHPR